jgi:hypothetical protein
MGKVAQRIEEQHRQFFERIGLKANSNIHKGLNRRVGFLFPQKTNNVGGIKHPLAGYLCERPNSGNH